MNATATTWEDIVEVTSKPTRLAIPIHTQFADMISSWTSLDLEEKEEFEFEDPCSDTSSNCSGRNVESKLPPPMPCFDRHTRKSAPSPSLIQGVISRASSSPITQKCGIPTGNELFQTRGMTQSMPNLHSSRSLYNRGIGYSLLSSASECGEKEGRRARRARVQEFEALLGDL
jgi:hypothetical protein